MWREWLIVAVAAVATKGQLMDKLKANRPGFYKLLSETDDTTIKSLLENVVTIFAPSDTALNAFKGKKDANFIKNHIENVAINKDALKQRLTTILKGHPPLWIRKIGDTTYVNNAKVSLVDSISKPQIQRLYYIDAVLEPLIPNSKRDEDFVDIKAGDMITKDNYDLGGYSISKFANQVKQMGISNFPELNSYAKATFFFPIDSAFDNMLPNVIDKEVVRTHIVPGQLLFTSPLTDNPNSADYKHSSQSNSRESPMKTMVSMYTDNTGKAAAQSLTLVGSATHKRNAKVVARVVKGNIPVANGVVHLIEKPLLVISSTLWESIEINAKRQENNRFKRFASYLEAYAPGLIEKIKTTANATILVPNNDAFDKHSNASLEALFKSAKGEEILGLHMVDGIYLQSNDFRIHRPTDIETGMYSITASYPEDSTSKLWFWVNKTKDQIELEKKCEEEKKDRCELDGTIMVDGGGITAKILEKDIGASNGVIQVIDKVLGIPAGTVEDKISSDPMMKKTYSLGKQEHFNNKLTMSDDLQFTYLVPSDQAWEKARREFTTAIKQINMPRFSYQTVNILERHLKNNAKLSLDELMEKGTVTMSRGAPLSFFNRTIDGEKKFMVAYENREAVIVRPNIECTNGYIHVIDTVIMKRRDVTLGGGNGILPSLIALCSTFILTLLLL